MERKVLGIPSTCWKRTETSTDQRSRDVGSSAQAEVLLILLAQTRPSLQTRSMSFVCKGQLQDPIFTTMRLAGRLDAAYTCILTRTQTYQTILSSRRPRVQKRQLA